MPRIWETCYEILPLMNCRWVGLGAVALLVLLVVASPFDLPMARAITDQGNSLGRFIQDFGTVPQAVMIVAAILILVMSRLRRGYPLLARASSALIMQSLLHALAFCIPLKFLWGRTRPADLISRGIEFMPFYIPNPGGHGLSFPSGHVAAALVLMPVVFILFKAGRTKAAIATAIITVLWAGPVVFGRMVFGAHFLTDILFSIGTAILFAPLSIKVGDWYLTKFEKKAA